MFDLKSFYKILNSELLGFGITAKDKSSFIPCELTNSLKISISDMDSLINDFSNLGIDLIAHANKSLSYEIVADFREQVYGLTHDAKVETITERKYFLDLAIHETKKSYYQYIVEQLRASKSNFKNCLVMSEDFGNYEIIDSIYDSMNTETEYEGLDNGDVVFYDKGIRYNVMQTTYSKSVAPNSTNKLNFIFYDKFIASLVYNSEKNTINKIASPNTFVQRNRLEFLYDLDFTKHKVVQVEVPTYKKI